MIKDLGIDEKKPASPRNLKPYSKDTRDSNMDWLKQSKKNILNQSMQSVRPKSKIKTSKNQIQLLNVSQEHLLKKLKKRAALKEKSKKVPQTLGELKVSTEKILPDELLKEIQQELENQSKPKVQSFPFARRAKRRSTP